MNIDYFTYLASVPSTELPCTWRTASLASCIEGTLGNLKELSRKTTLLIFVLFSSIFPHLPPSPKCEPHAWYIWQGNCGRQFMQMTSNQDSWGCTGGRKREKKIMKKKSHGLGTQAADERLSFPICYRVPSRDPDVQFLAGKLPRLNFSELIK